MMTVGEHDSLWMSGAKALPKIRENLQNANIIACANALHDIGEISDDDYKKTLVFMLKQSGIDLK